MIEQDNCIVDQALPDAISFTALNGRGLARLQQIVGKVWTNYNPSDPGVTILEQLCYALTELGYVSQFPIEDVLTQEDGKTRFHDQFFEPQNILTTAPVTTDDFRRIIHDELDDVRVAYVDAERDASGAASGRYQVSLAWNTALPKEEADVICGRLQLSLNRQRNIGELFLRPAVFHDEQVIAITLAGAVELADGAQSDAVYSAISQALAQYAAPLPQRSGYREWTAQGLGADDIFSGPRMHNGWIPGPDALGHKRKTVNLYELNRLIAAVPGVGQVQSLSLSCTPPPAPVPPGPPPAPTISIPIDAGQIATIVLAPDFRLIRNRQPAEGARQHSAEFELAAIRAAHRASTPDAQVDLHPALPSGRYRNIESYYSIQNTFPEVYCIGMNSLQSDDPSYPVAMSRQLKGYLMVFDQMLANQFSQLAHLGDLFSFRPIVPKAGSEGKPQPKPDAWSPYRKFATTYFSQPLYDVPHVKRLLRGNEVFHYSFDPTTSPQQLEREAWKKFKKYPFNAYIAGLREAAETDSEACTRRDAMLSHLMARHGDDASRYEDIIDACHWYGSSTKTRILVKSIWLQNFQLLSYYRNTAFDITATQLLLMPGDPTIVKAGKAVAGQSLSQHVLQAVYPTHEGELDQAQFYADAHIRKSDFEQYCGFELKLGILLGLPVHCQMLAARLYALLECPAFVAWLDTPEPQRKRFSLPESDTVVMAAGDKDQVFAGPQCLIDVSRNGQRPNRQDYIHHAHQLLWLGRQRKGMILLEHILLLPFGNLPTVAAVAAAGKSANVPAPQTPAVNPYYLQATLILPQYVTLVQRPDFTRFIDTLRDLHWPMHVQLNVAPKSFDYLKAFIPLFVKWRNNLPNADIRDPLSALLAKLLGLSNASGGAHAN